MLTEWEDKCNDLDEQLQESKNRQIIADNGCMKAQKDLQMAQKETRAGKHAIKAREEEILNMQKRYEREL